MPIVAIEGPDKCGKSTLFSALKRLYWPVQPQFVETPTFGKERMHVAAELALRELEMWESLYRSDTLYICNRHVLVTDRVYARLYNRKILRESWLEKRVLVVYIDVPVDELRRRHRVCGEEIQDVDTYGRVLKLYDRVLSRFNWLRVTTQTPQEIQRCVLETYGCS